MLTTEEIRALLLPVDPDYLIKHGIDSESDALFERDKNGILVTYHETALLTADEVRELRDTLPTPEEDPDFTVMLSIIYNVQLADVYSRPRLDLPDTAVRLMKVLDILRENGITPPDISVLPQDRKIDGGYGNTIDEQKYTLIVKGETFPDRRKKQ